MKTLMNSNKIKTEIVIIITIYVNQGFTFPVDCTVGDWKPWGDCSATFCGGTKTRAEEVVEEPKNRGATFQLGKQ